MNVVAPAPAQALLAKYGTVLNSIGASRVETDVDTITLAFSGNKQAVNADAMLKDIVEGVKLVVKNESTTADVQRPSAYGIQDVLSGVQGLTVQAQVPRCICLATVNVTADTPALEAAADALLEPKPAELIEIAVHHAQQPAAV